MRVPVALLALLALLGAAAAARATRREPEPAQPRVESGAARNPNLPAILDTRGRPVPSLESPFYPQRDVALPAVRLGPVLQPIAVPGGDANNAMTLGAMPRDVTGQLGGGTNTGGAA
jgi:hypothetical protein